VRSVGPRGLRPPGSWSQVVLDADDRTWLFAVDVGSDQISVLKVREDGQLALLGVSPLVGGSGQPDLSRWPLYVLNAANASTAAANVAGFRVDEKGLLRPIAGATRALSATHPSPA